MTAPQNTAGDLADSSQQAKAALRAAMRARRASLTSGELAEAGAAVTRRLLNMPEVAEARLVGSYRAVRGEVPVESLAAQMCQATLTVPRVVGDRLEFVVWQAGQEFVKGSFGIAEPLDGEATDFAAHDIVLVPLVAFDSQCRRLGQGGGFYDRALADLQACLATEPTEPTEPTSRPIVVGVAHWFQSVAQVPVEPWDVTLDAVVTDRELLISQNGRLM